MFKWLSKHKEESENLAQAAHAAQSDAQNNLSNVDANQDNNNPYQLAYSFRRPVVSFNQESVEGIVHKLMEHQFSLENIDKGHEFKIDLEEECCRASQAAQLAFELNKGESIRRRTFALLEKHQKTIELLTSEGRKEYTEGSENKETEGKGKFTQSENKPGEYYSQTQEVLDSLSKVKTIRFQKEIQFLDQLPRDIYSIATELEALHHLKKRGIRNYSEISRKFFDNTADQLDTMQRLMKTTQTNVVEDIKRERQLEAMASAEAKQSLKGPAKEEDNVFVVKAKMKMA